VPQEPDPLKRPSSYRPSRPIPKRRQYRRRDWEDSEDPQLAEPTAPVILPATASDAEARNVKVEVFRARHESKQRLHHADDASNPEPDITGNLLRLARDIRDQALNHRGLRTATRKPSRVHPWTPGRFRVQVWNSETQRNLHLGYVQTVEAVERAKAKYFLSKGISLNVPLPDWLGELIRIATSIQAESEHRGDDTIVDLDVTPRRRGRTPDEREDAVRLALVGYGHLHPLTEAEIAAHTGLAGHELTAAIRGAANRGLVTATEVDGERRYAATLR